MWKIIVILLSLPALSFSALCQDKYEREIRIKTNEVPKKALRFVDSLSFQSKIKWYKEFSSNGYSFEAKTRKSHDKYSIEFSENGDFEDLEIEIDSLQLPKSGYSKMIDYFDSENSTYKIIKIQQQYSGNASAVLNYFLNEKRGIKLIIKYEIVLSRKEEGTFVMYEYLFDEDGEFEKRSRIMLNMTDNLEY